ncbi:MAG: hypothetical protein FWD54_00580 [Endomicrobia bacterium]|nr:hypothetical protein [Endomicrobiia bacterium]
MKKFLLFPLLMIVLFSINGFSQTINVSSYSYLQQLFRQAGVRNVVLIDNITGTERLGSMASSGIMTISGNYNLSVSLSTSSNGGAFSVTNSTLTFNTGGNITFSSNSATNYGGAIYNTRVINFETAAGRSVIFSNNTADYGGAIYNTGASANITFTNGNIMFAGNRADVTSYTYGGGAIYNQSGGQINFDMSSVGKVTFSSNTAASSGGAIYNNGDNSQITFTNGDILFFGNKANGAGSITGGGAICNYLGQINFDMSSSGRVTFSSNTATSGGAIYHFGLAGNSKTVFANGDIIFIGNSANYGGAIYTNGSSSISFAGSNVRFGGNTAATSGGAICNEGGQMDFEMFSVGAITFSSNTARFGGAIYNSRTISFRAASGSNIIFSSNTATSSGGVIYNSSGQINFEMSSGGKVTFSSNTAASNGGVIYNDGWSANTKITFTNGDILFDGNRASSGGAIHSEYNSIINFTSSTITFTGNVAQSSGGAIYNYAGGQISFEMSSGGKLTFSSNTARWGGAISNNRANSTITFTNGNIMFIGNSASSLGGAVYNEGTINFETVSGSSITFIGNRAGDGSAGNGNDIYNSGTINITGGGAVIISSGIAGSGTINNAANVYLNGNSSGYTGTYTQTGGTTAISASFFNGTNNITAGTIQINDGAVINSVLSMGASSLLNINVTGTIALQRDKFIGTTFAVSKTNSGTLNISEDFSAHTGAFTQTAGNTNVTNKTFNSMHTIDGGTLTFATGAVVAANTKVSVGTNGTLSLTGNDNLSFAASFLSGNGTVNKSGTGTLDIAGNNSAYTGTYTQTNGNTIVTSNYFNGQSNINGGTLTFATGTAVAANTKVSVGISGTLSLTGNDNLSFGTSFLSGNGTVNKSGTGTLNITGDNSLFTGTFTQTAGQTIVYETGKMFSGTNAIATSTLTVYGAASAASMGYNVNLGNNAISDYYSKNTVPTILNETNINFTGTGAKANFLNSGTGDYAYYVLNSSYTGVVGNSVNFKNSFVSFAPSNFSGNIEYSFENSVIDIANTVSNSTRTITFNRLNLIGANNGLNFGIRFSSHAGNTYSMDTDKIDLTGGGSGVIGSIFDIRVYYGEELADLNGTFNSRVLYGGLMFATNISSFTLGMGVHTYKIGVNSDWQTINVTIDGGGGVVYTLYDYNAGTVGTNRAWVWNNSSAYYIDKELGITAPGLFSVSGNDGVASRRVISGKINNGSTYGSLFKITDGVNASTFTLENITVTQALADGMGGDTGHGSVLYMDSAVSEALIKNVIIAENSSVYFGGAIYLGAGKLTVEDTVFSSNTADSGGAVSLADGSSALFKGNISFINNTANGLGGAIYAEGTNSVFNASTGSISFTSNKSMTGGAIYNIIFSEMSFSAGQDISFNHNNASGCGGAINSEFDSFMTFASGGDVLFNNNKAPSFGGAIHAGYYSDMKFSAVRDIVFDSNSSFYGGAVYSDCYSYMFFTANRDIIFNNNKSDNIGDNNMPDNVGGTFGGAVYAMDNSSMTFTAGRNITFSNNKALEEGTGGAIFTYASSTSFIATNNISFTGNQSAAEGGALYVWNSIMNFNASSITFNTNVAVSSGGAIYNKGSVLAFNGNVLFSSNTASSGGAIYNDGGTINFVTTAGSSVTFAGNTASGLGKDIYNAGGTINITGAGAVIMDGGIAGWGSITKGTGAGRLNLSGDNSSFYGTFTQTVGQTTVYETGKMFGGTNAISNSTVTVYGAASAASMGYNLDLGNNAVSDYYSKSTGTTTLDRTNINFTGTGANANFRNSGTGDYAYYVLNSSFTGSTGNSVNFKNSFVSFAANSFVGNIGYSFENSVIDITNTVGSSTRTITFDKLSLIGSSNALNFGIRFSSHAGNTYSMDTDKINLTTGSGVIGSIFDIRVYYGEELADLNGTFNSQVLYNGLTFATSISSFTLGMGVHSYKVSVDTNNWQNINVTIEGGSGILTLYDYNAMVGPRAWVWNEAGTYYIDRELGDTGAGLFSVSGNDSVASKWVVSGKINNGSTYGSMFKLVNASTFTLKDITITQARADGTGDTGNGSVLYMSNALSESLIRNVVLNVNTSVGNGGAVYFGAGKLTIENTTFSGNTATLNGGALYLASGRSAEFNGNMIFANNSAGQRGGAVFLSSNTIVNFNTGGSNINITFNNNTDTNGLNDIYFSNSSTINFNASNYSIILENGLIAEGNGIINKTGNGNLIFGGNTVMNIAQFNISGGNIVFLDSATFKGTSMILSAGSALDLQNGTVNTITVDTFSSTTNTKIDIFANNNECDKIIAGNATVGGNLDIKTYVGTYDNQTYEILLSTLTNVQGLFTSTSTNNGLLKFTFNDYANSDRIILTINGTFASNLSNLEGLSFNQKETARVLDKLSTDSSISSALAGVITEITSKNEAEQMAALSDVAGHFISNIVRNFAIASPNTEIYDKINNADDNGIWTQVRGGQETFKENENSLEDYIDNSLGALLGYDCVKNLTDSNLVYGVFARFVKDSAEQGESKSDGTKIGGGLYAGYVNKNWEIKTMVLGSMDNFNSERYIPTFDKTAKAEIEAITISADIEGALYYELTNNVSIKPYVGMEAGNVNYKDFKETGAPGLNLEVKGDSYIRSAARFGLGIECGQDKWNVYLKGEGKYLIMGYEPEILGVFEDTGESFTSRGAKEEGIQIGVLLGGDVFITSNIKMFINANYYTGENYINMSANAGFRFLLGI